MNRDLVLVWRSSRGASSLVGPFAAALVFMACASPPTSGGTTTSTRPSDPYRCHQCNIHLVATALSPGKVALSWNEIQWQGQVQPGFEGAGFSYVINRLDGGPITFGTGGGATGMVLTGFLPVTEYCFYVVAPLSFPYLGSAGDSNLACATTPPDVTAPDAVGALATSDPATHSIRLDWIEPDDDGLVVGYEIERDAEHLASTTSQSFTDATPDSDAAVCYQITAKDAGGNESAALKSCAIPSTPSLITTTAVSTPGRGRPVVAVGPGSGVHVGHLGPQTGLTTYELRHATPATGGGAWSSTTVDAAACAEGSYALALDASGNVHMSFCGGSIYALRYATNASGSWSVETVDSDWVGLFSSLALDPAGKAHIGYYDYQRGFIKYATNASGQWTVSTIAAAYLPGGSTSTLSIALDSAGKAHLSYHDGVLHYATNVSGEWSVSVLESDGSAPGATSIGIDTSDHVHLAYADPEHGLVRHATDATGAWIFETLGAGAGPVTLDLGPDDALHVSFVETLERWVVTGTSQELNILIRVVYATGTAGSWVVYPTNASSASQALALDAASRAHVVFRASDGIHHAIFSAR
jgi:hypothetical protein